jgi:carbonic anhydrase
MSTQSIDISKKNISGKCDLKCSYNFQYPESNTTAKNQGVLINLTYDNSKTPPVIYNNQKYTVTGISITSPSLHLFDGATTDAEVIIEHAPIKGGPLLKVGIPIKSSSESSDASYLLKEIIDVTGTNSPSQGESTNVSISSFTLNKIVPSKPYYSYTDSNKDDWIMFGILDAIPLNSDTITTLQKIIKPFPLPMTGGELFINTSGPNSTKVGEGIYISCKPTGSSSEETEVEYSKDTPSYDFSNILDNPVTKTIFQIIVGVILFLIVFMIFNYIYQWITTGETKMPAIPAIASLPKLTGGNA